MWNVETGKIEKDIILYAGWQGEEWKSASDINASAHCY
jgi:hypothetical protein